MTTLEEHRTTLRDLGPEAWPAYLLDHSGLPGPRANLTLVQAVADVADLGEADALIAGDEEYLVLCGVVALGAHAADPEIEARLRRHAADERWRVREGVALALQRLGDQDLPALLGVVADWVEDPDPLVQRAAVAAICEPRLLRSAPARAAALAACRRTTQRLAALPPSERRRPGVRTLRQALGYCWSVAVAADPEPGLPEFAALDEADADVAWIVRTNRGKARLSRLL